MKFLIVCMGMLAASSGYSSSFTVVNTVSWAFAPGPAYAPLFGDQTVGVNGANSSSGIPFEGEAKSAVCSAPAVVTCSNGFTVNAFNSFPSTPDYALQMYALATQVDPTAPVSANGQTQLNVGATGGTLLLPIPTLDCSVQVATADARCDVSLAAVQLGAPSYINTYRGFQLSGSASADMTATGFSISGDDYVTSIYFHQGNFSDPGTGATLAITASGGKVTAASFGAGSLPPASLIAPAIGSSSTLTLSFPSIPYLGISPDYPFSYFALDQFLTGNIDVAAVPEPNSLWLALTGLAAFALTSAAQRKRTSR